MNVLLKEDRREIYNVHIFSSYSRTTYETTIREHEQWDYKIEKPCQSFVPQKIHLSIVNQAEIAVFRY